MKRTLLFTFLAFVPLPAFIASVAHAKPPTSTKTEPTKQVSEPDKVNILTADEAQLKLLPGVGAKLAATIVKVRIEHQGEIKSCGDLAKVKGIGEAKLAQIEPHCCVDCDGQLATKLGRDGEPSKGKGGKSSKWF